MTATRTGAPEGTGGEQAVMTRLPVLDRFLPVWIGAAMAAGLLLGRLVPGLNGALNRVAIHGTSLPIALGLLLMMYPVLAKVRYTEIGKITADRRMMTASLLLNWIIGPAVMFALAWLFLPDQPAYRTGVILVGLARCIAMVLIWTDLARGDREMATVLVALNAVFQVLLYSVLGFFYLQVLPGWLGLGTASLHVSIGAIAGTVAVFLGIPLAAGYLTRTLGERFRGREWYESRFLPRIAPVALYGLLFTVVILFALQGKKITAEPPTWPGSRCRCWPTSPSCGSPGSRSAAACACPTRAPRRWRSPRRATTSSWRSRSRSAYSVSPAGRRWPALSARLSRCR